MNTLLPYIYRYGYNVHTDAVFKHEFPVHQHTQSINCKLHEWQYYYHRSKEHNTSCNCTPSKRLTMAFPSLEIEESESLVSSSTVGTGGKNSAPASGVMGAIVLVVCEPKNRKRVITIGFFMAMLLLIASANMGSSTVISVANDDTIELTFVDPAETALGTSLPVAAVDQKGEITVTDKKDSGEGDDITIIEAPKEQVNSKMTEAPKEEIKIVEAPKKIPKKPSKIPLLEPDIQTGRADEKTRGEQIDKWGSWHFWDGEASRRPKDDFGAQYPNRDVPGNKFPDTAWQVDAVYVNHFINDGEKIIQRAMEAIFTEYGKGKPLPPEKMAERYHMFHWEMLDFTKSQDPPPEFTKKGSRDIGGWTTKRSFDGLVRRLLHAMLTQDTFTVVLAGHSAAQGQGYVVDKEVSSLFFFSDLILFFSIHVQKSLSTELYNAVSQNHEAHF